MLSKNMRGSDVQLFERKTNVRVLRKDTQQTRPTLGQIKKAFLT